MAETMRTFQVPPPLPCPMCGSPAECVDGVAHLYVCERDHGFVDHSFWLRPQAED